MKVIRELKPVSVCTDLDRLAENDTDFTLDILDSEPGHFGNVIRPMLKKGHEGELIKWLKTSGLIPQYQKCKNADQNENCRKPLTWYSSRTMDQYQWKCLNCSRKYSIRENSVFIDVRCNIKDALRLILGWCKGRNVETMMGVLGIRKQVVNSAYRMCANISNKYIKNRQPEWQMGGPNTIVIIDVYPEGCKKYDYEHFENIPRNTFPILCIAEARENPPRYWFEILSRNVKSKEDQTQAALAAIVKMVCPGSVLVTNLESSICSYHTLQSLKHLYPIIVSVDGLQRHDTESQRILSNLGEIWKQALNICDYVQSSTMTEVQNNLANVLWRRKFGSEAFEVLLNQMNCGDM